MRKTKKDLKPLRITCTSSNCASNLHCFKKAKKMAEEDYGKCRSCGIELVDWHRVHKRDVKDSSFVFVALKTELIRHHFWHKAIDIRAINHARRKGLIKLEQATKKRLEKYIAPLNNAFDGRQTPQEGNIIFYAQHALACCCRTCLEYWHGIPKNAEMTSEDIDYFTSLILMYVKERLPDLSLDGEKIPNLLKV